MPSKKYLIVYWIIALIPIIVTAIVYPSLPDIIPTHFGANNEADAFGSKNSVWLLSIIFFILNLFVLGSAILAAKYDRGNKSILEIQSVFKIMMVTAVFVSITSLVLLYGTVNYNSEKPVDFMMFSYFSGVTLIGYVIYESIRIKKILKQQKK